MNIHACALSPIASEVPFADDVKSELHTWVSGDPLPEEIELAARVARVKEMLAAGADVHERDEFAHTPLHVTDDIEIAQLLLEAGASVDAINEDGDTPLHSVCSSSPEMAEFFISKGADTEALNSYGEIALKSILNFRGAGDLPRMVEAFRRGIERRNERLIVAPDALNSGIFRELS